MVVTTSAGRLASARRAIGKAVGLVLLAACIHALVLRFVFPGFYAPTSFNHSDFYIPIAVVHNGTSFFSLFMWPRPIGAVYLYVTGAFGLNGSIVATLAVILLNMALVGLLVRQYCNLRFDYWFVIFFALFSFAIFSHPYFFVGALHDVFSHLSFLFLCVGFMLILNKPKLNPFDLTVAFIFWLLAFLSKEGFVLSAVWLLGLIGFARRKSGALTAFSPAATAVVAFLLATAYNLMISSAFISGSADPDAAYRQSHDVTVVLGLFWRYLGAGLPWGAASVLLALLIVCFLCAPSRRVRVVALALPVAGFAAVLPNSVLPNHYFPEYSWNMTYLLFAPILLFPALIGRVINSIGQLGAALAVTLVLGLLPHTWKTRYASNEWSLGQGNIQRNITLSLDLLTTAAAFGSERRHVLVSGIVSPFSPFVFGSALMEWIGEKEVRFDVVAYSAGWHDASPVHFVPPSNVRLEDYTDVWVFSPSGIGRELTSSDDLAVSDLLGKKEMILYPAVQEALGRLHIRVPRVPSFYHLLGAGILLIQYRAYDLAISFLERAIILDRDNPYPPYYLATAFEALGQMDDAASAARRAVEIDNPASPNPAFRQLLNRLARHSD